MPQDIKDLLNFEVRLYGELLPYTQTLSKCRCRIFYKYGNRNGTYITDEFANELIRSLPYAPIKGIYDEEDGDYTDHGRKRNMGRIYGIVPVDNNFAWENHLDDDGETRTYACTDVLVYTALYKEASEVIKKGQSMELYDKSIEGDWQILDGIQYYVFKHGCFLGLQVLGDSTEPCFEGAAFYSLYQDIYQKLKDTLEELNQLKEKELNTKKDQEESLMPKINFANNNDTFSTLWQLLNSNFTEENNWTINYEVFDYSENENVFTVLAKNLETNEFVKVQFSKTTEEVEAGEGEEKTTVEKFNLDSNEVISICEIDSTFFTKVAELFGRETVEEFSTILDEISNLKEKISEFEQKIVEKDETISTLQSEKDNLQSDFDNQKEQLNTLTTENDQLKQYQIDVEKGKKEAVLQKYSVRLDAEIIDSFNNKLDEYTVDSLEKELAYALVTSDTSIFTEDNDNVEGRLPKEKEKTGLDAILSKYKK